jgi:hypothetical protein
VVERGRQLSVIDGGIGPDRIDNRGRHRIGLIDDATGGGPGIHRSDHRDPSAGQDEHLILASGLIAEVADQMRKLADRGAGRIGGFDRDLRDAHVRPQVAAQPHCLPATPASDQRTGRQ